MAPVQLGRYLLPRRRPPPEPALLGADYARYMAEFAELWTGVAREANITAS